MASFVSLSVWKGFYLKPGMQFSEIMQKREYRKSRDIRTVKFPPRSRFKPCTNNRQFGYLFKTGGNISTMMREMMTRPF